MNISTPPASTTTDNSSMNGTLDYLHHLHRSDLPLIMPSLVFLVLVALCGTVGNSLVLEVYRRRRRKTATEIFILAMAAFDLLANVLTTPGVVYMWYHMWIYDDTPLCKWVRYTIFVSTSPGAFLLLAVAFVRYRKVCQPHRKQLTKRHAKIISASIAGVMAVVSVPIVILSGRATVPTPRSGVFGYKCGIDDLYKDSKLPQLYYSFIFLLYLLALVPLIVIYTVIGYTVLQHNKRRQSIRESERPRSYLQNPQFPIIPSSCDTSHFDSDTSAAGLDQGSSRIRIADDTQSTDLSCEDNLLRGNRLVINGENNVRDTDKDSRKRVTLLLEVEEYPLDRVNSDRDVNSPEQSKTHFGTRCKKRLSVSVQKLKLGKTTPMLFFTSLAYIFTYAPALTLQVYTSLNPDLFVAMSDAAKSCYFLFFNFVFVGSIINPVVYSLCNKMFRRQCWAVFRCDN